MSSAPPPLPAADNGIVTPAPEHDTAEEASAATQDLATTQTSITQEAPEASSDATGGSLLDPLAPSSEPEATSSSHARDASPDSSAEPLSRRDIEQVVVPASFYTSDDGEVDDHSDAAQGRVDALRPVDLSSLIPPPAPVDEEVLSDAAPMPLSVRDFEEDLTVDASQPPDSESEPLSLRDVEEDLTPRGRRAASAAGGTSPSKRSVPPPLPSRPERPGFSGPPVAQLAPPGSGEPISQALLRSMRDRLAAADHEGAFIAASTLLRIDPELPEALQTTQIAKAALYRIYDERLGSRDRVPTVIVRAEDLRCYPLDARGALVLSRLDGTRTIDDVIHSGILPKLDTLQVLSELYLQGIVGFADSAG